MNNKLGNNLGVDADDAVNIVEELQLAQRSQVGALRAAAVRRVHAPVQVRPADSIERDRVVSAGSARELGATSVTALLSRPVVVGSFFVIEFDRSHVDLAPVLARCDLCCLRSESEFEAHFVFVQPTVIPEPSATPS